MEASTASMNASMEAMKSSVEAVEASMEAMEASMEAFVSFHLKCRWHRWSRMIFQPSTWSRVIPNTTFNTIYLVPVSIR